MVNNYKLFFYLIFLFQTFLKVYSTNPYGKKIPNLISLDKLLASQIYNKLNQAGPPPDEEESNNRDKPWPYNREELYKEYEKLLEKEKELKEMYDYENSKLLENERQLKYDKIYITILIVIASFLALLIIIFSCYEFYKYRKKKKLQITEPLSKINSFGKEFKSSFESSKSTDESNKKNSSYNPSQSDDYLNINNSSNFNILIKSKINNNKKEEEDKKEQEIIINPYKDNEDEAPIRFSKNNNLNNNINIINNYNDDMKTLTNDEDVYFASRTDKLLYKPYWNEEINKK